ncbi:MAG: hypothetical protein ACRYF9_10195 [Janthinobacterium lividum]|uniref:hypothetical protein n=1 Tax=Pseudomonas baltica TaxID=2762576 RepID=UPI00289B7071|nr:hypothetical protein [Pseudomonas baltica]
MTRTRLELPSDTTLVAFLDGELDASDAARIEALREREPAIAQRLTFLEQGCVGIPEGFAPLLDAAPLAHLQAMLGGLPPVAAATPVASSWSRRRLLAGAAACVVAGVVADRTWHGWQSTHWVANGSWRGSVAQYMALYTEQTLEGLDPSAATQAPQLARVGEQLGIALTPAWISLPGAHLRRAQVLRYDVDLIAQLVYLDQQYGPLALCFVRSADAPHAPAEEVRNGLNVLYWNDGEHAWMLAGRNPMADLRSKQARLALG